MKRCDRCVFWVINEQWNDDDLEEDEKLGGCHRHAPSPLIGDVAYEILRHLTNLAWEVKPVENEYRGWEDAPQQDCSWPQTKAADWCGDFLKRAVISDVP